MLGAFDLNSFCTETKTVLTFVGWIITIVKIAIPIIIIVYGILDLGKAVTSSDQDEIKKGAKRLMFRAIAGVAIFFVPSIVMWLFRAVDEYRDATGGSEDGTGSRFAVCEKAILRPYEN